MSEQDLDSNVLGSPSCRFRVIFPGINPAAGWAFRKDLLPRAGLATRCRHAVRRWLSASPHPTICWAQKRDWDGPTRGSQP
jgi:hypothetical protein